MCLSASPFRAILPIRRCALSPILMALFFCATFLRPEPSMGLAVLSALPLDMDLHSRGCQHQHFAQCKPYAFEDSRSTESAAGNLPCNRYTNVD